MCPNHEHIKYVTRKVQLVQHLWFCIVSMVEHKQFNYLCKGQIHTPRKSIPPSLTLMPWHLKTIVPQKLCFFRGIHPNGLHFVLKLQVWIFSEKDVMVNLALSLEDELYCTVCNGIAN